MSKNKIPLLSVAQDGRWGTGCSIVRRGGLVSEILKKQVSLLIVSAEIVM